MDELTVRIVGWILFLIFMAGVVRVVAASLREEPRRCSLCGSKNTRPVVYRLRDTEWTCDDCGYLWSAK